MTPRVLVVGASGHVGRWVARSLAAIGARCRLAGPRPESLERVTDGVEVVRLDLRDPGTFAAAVHGVDRLFLVRPPAIADVGPTLNAFIDRAVEAGARHVVFSSVAGAETSRWVPHRKVERHLFASGLDWTVLRPGFFSQNFESAYRLDVVEDDRVFVPAGRGRVAFIDTRDIGAVAARVLVDPAAHRGRCYLLTGPEAVTFEDAVGRLSVAIGREVRYEPAGVAGYVLHLRRRRGLSWMQVIVQTVLHLGLRRGNAEVVDPSLESLLERPPTSFDVYARDRRSIWSTERTASDEGVGPGSDESGGRAAGRHPARW